MNTGNRLEAHPELQKYVEAMLDIAEDVNGTLKRADDAEIKIVDTIRKMGAALLHEWATKQEETTIAQWKKEHPEAQRHGKKKSIGKPRLVDLS
jgi:hypothetical protein